MARFSNKRDERKQNGRKGSKSAYKSKRSFSKNKNFRDEQRSGGGHSERDRKSTARPFKPKFERDRDTDKKPAFKRGKEGFTERRKSGFDHRDERKPTREKSFAKDRDKSPRRRDDDNREFSRERKDTRGQRPSREQREKRFKHEDFEEGRAFSSDKRKFKGKVSKSAPVKKQTGEDGLIRLNKYLSNAGIASRREADNLIQSGAVKVNGVVVDQLGYKIKPGDKVTYGDEAVKAERKVYLLLNKPKDYITTVDDPRERKTVMELIQGACRERVYPVGRLDRNTTGLLLFTNDGELTTKLTHPKYGIKKIYHVTLNKGLKPDDFRALVEGIELEDGETKADDLAFVGEGKKEVGVEIHSGRNRIVRRMFEHLGYEVLKLDRVVFAGLTKKDLPRGKYRFLSPKEVAFLQMIG